MKNWSHRKADPVKDFLAATKRVREANEVLRQLANSGATAEQAMRAFNSAALHVQMHGRALRYRPFTWRMTRGKQPRRVKIYSRVNRSHVIDYGVEPRANDFSMALRYAVSPSEFQRQYECQPHVDEPPVVRDAKMQAICDNWEPKV